jgi:hypothetical protein
MFAESSSSSKGCEQRLKSSRGRQASPEITSQDGFDYKVVDSRNLWPRPQLFWFRIEPPDQ